MAKGTRGGKRVSTAGGATVNPTAATLNANANVNPQAQDQQQAKVDDTQPVQAMSASYQQFMALDDDGKADVITNMIAQPTPDFLSDSALQRLTYNLGLNDKPQLVDDKVLDSMNGTEIFRTVNSVYDGKNDLNYTAVEIGKQLQKGSMTRYSDSGGSVYGRGIYFANSYGSSVGYGRTNGNVKSTAVVRAKLNGNAKVAKYDTIYYDCIVEMNNKNTKLGRALKKCDADSAVSIYALAKGYNVLETWNGYYNVLNRNAITMSNSIKPKGRNW